MLSKKLIRMRSSTYLLLDKALLRLAGMIGTDSVKITVDGKRIIIESAD